MSAVLPRSARVRALARAALVQLCLIGQAAVLGHALLVPHSSCLEHGTVSHDDHAHDHAGAGRGRVATESHELAVRARDAHTVIEDEHCDVLGRHEPSSPPVLRAARVGDVTDETVARPVPAPPLASAAARYRLAPKTSPPTA